MAELQVTYVQCDFCPNRAQAGSDEDDFHTIGTFDLCGGCFEKPYQNISYGIGAAWNQLYRKGDRSHNNKVLALLRGMSAVALLQSAEKVVTE